MTVTCSREWCKRGYLVRWADWETLLKSDLLGTLLKQEISLLGIYTKRLQELKI
jgi:hypothetical protein